MLIANSEQELLADFEEHVASRVQTAARIHFDRYGTSELVGIFEDFAQWGLRDGAVAAEQLWWIADAAVGTPASPLARSVPPLRQASNGSWTR